MTNTSKKGKTEKLEPKVTVGPKQAAVTMPKEPAKPEETSQPKPNELVVPPKPKQSHIKIFVHLDNLPMKYVWSLLAGSSHPSPPSILGQLARGLSSKSLPSLCVYGSTA